MGRFLTLLRRCSIARGGCLRIAPAIRRVVHVRRHSVLWLGSAIGNGHGGTSHRHRAVSASAAAEALTSASTTASRASVRSLVNTDGTSVEPAVWLASEGHRGGEGGGGFLLDVVHRVDGLLCVIIVGVPNKTKSTAAASVAVLDNHLLRGRPARVRSIFLQM